MVIQDYRLLYSQEHTYCYCPLKMDANIHYTNPSRPVIINYLGILIPEDGCNLQELTYLLE